MTSSRTPAAPALGTHRPAAVLVTAGLLAFLGVSAVGGGAAIVSGTATPPDSWLDRVPLIDSWLVPGLVLGLGFGAGSLLVGYAMLRRTRVPVLRFAERLTGHHWSWAATLLIGFGHAVWIGLELVYLPQLSALQAVYGGVALALLVLPLHPEVRHYLARQHEEADNGRCGDQ